MAVDSPCDQTNGNNIRLELKLELAEVQHPWEFVQLFHLHCSAHGFTHQPGTKMHTNNIHCNAGTTKMCSVCFACVGQMHSGDLKTITTIRLM